MFKFVMPFVLATTLCMAPVNASGLAVSTESAKSDACPEQLPCLKGGSCWDLDVFYLVGCTDPYHLTVAQGGVSTTTSDVAVGSDVRATNRQNCGVQVQTNYRFGDFQLGANFIWNSTSNPIKHAKELKETLSTLCLNPSGAVAAVFEAHPKWNASLVWLDVTMQPRFGCCCNSFFELVPFLTFGSHTIDQALYTRQVFGETSIQDYKATQHTWGVGPGAGWLFSIRCGNFALTSRTAVHGHFSLHTVGQKVTDAETVANILNVDRLNNKCHPHLIFDQDFDASYSCCYNDCFAYHFKLGWFSKTFLGYGYHLTQLSGNHDQPHNLANFGVRVGFGISM